MGIEMVLDIVARNYLGECDLENGGKSCEIAQEAIADELVRITFLLRQGCFRDIDFGNVDVLWDRHLRKVCVATEFNRGCHDMPIKIFSSVEIRVVEVVAHEKRLCAIIFQSSLESRQGGNSVPACIVEIARVDVTREASVGDSVGVWVGDWQKMGCIDAFSSSIMSDFMNGLPFRIFSCSLGICSLRPSR